MFLMFLGGLHAAMIEQAGNNLVKVGEACSKCKFSLTILLTFGKRGLKPSTSRIFFASCLCSFVFFKTILP